MPEQIVVEHRTFVEEGPKWPVHLAKVLAQDVYLEIEEGHAGFAKGWKATGTAIKNSAVGSIKNKWRHDKTSFVVTVGVGVVFLAATITVSVFTAGLGIPVLMGIAAGFYALKKAVGAGLEKAFSKRNNLNWLKYFDSIKKSDAVELEKDFSSNAADAVRRLVDHYRQAANLKSSLEHWRARVPDGGPPGIGEGKVVSCDDALNLVLTMARFRYQLNKALNYELCCLHTAILTINNYIQLAQAWNGVYGVLENALVAHIETCDHQSCKNACYGPQNPAPPGGYTDRMADLLRVAKKPLPVKRRPAPPAGQRAEIKLQPLRQKLYERALKFEKAIESSPDKVQTPQEIVAKAIAYAETNLRKANKVLGISEEMKASEALIVRMVNDAYKKVDDRSVFDEAGHFVQSYYRRTTAAEKGVACASVILEAGLALVGGALSGAESLGHLAQRGLVEVTHGIEVTASQGIKGGATGLEMLALDVAIKGAVSCSDRSAGADAMKSSLLQERLFGPTAKEAKELEDDTKKKKAGAAVQAFFLKASNHYIEAEKRLKEIQKKGDAFEIKTCDDAIAAAEPFYEFLHHMDKVLGNTLRALGLLFFLAEDLEKWIADEPGLWNLVQSQVAEWFVSCRHPHCRETGGHCYGPRVGSKGPDYKTPQKPL